MLAPTSTAGAETAADAIASLLGSPADDEEIGSSWGASEVSPDGEADENRIDVPASTATSFAGSILPVASVTPFASALGATKGSLAVLALPNLPLAPTASSSTPTPAAPSPAEPDDGSGLRTAGYVAAGVGLVGLGLFAIAGLGAKSAYDKLDSDCGDARCTDEAHRSDVEGGRMLQTTANIGLAAGLTGLGVGATLLVLGNRSSVEKRGPSASVSASGGMITYGGHF